MLREDKKAGFVQRRIFFMKRWQFVSGKIAEQGTLTEEQFNAFDEAQKTRAILVYQHGGRTWWCFMGRFYWEDEGLSESDVEALVLQRERRRERQLQRARDSLLLDDEPVIRRDPIPVEVQRAVWERDGGRCVQCGGTFSIQYDHIIPFSMGGASTVENLQILCAECNRTKGASIG